MRGGDQFVARSLIKHEKKMMSKWAFLGFFVMVMSFFALLSSYMGPLSIVNFQFTNLNLKEFLIVDTTNDPRETLFSAKNTSEPQQGICNFSLPRSDYCEINGDVRIHGNSSSIFISPSILKKVGSDESSWKLRPYARKVDRSVMKQGKVLSIGTPSSFGLNEMPNCTINHKIPAIVFSGGGYVGNIFHEFSDVLVPLYINSKPFDGEVQFLVTSLKPNWLIKHKPFFDLLTNYSIIDMDKSNEVHCFESAIIGLKNHLDFGIDPSKTPQGYTMTNFTQFVRDAYNLKRKKVDAFIKKPRLMIISRKGRRAMLNEDEVAREARGLGYDVTVMEARRNVEEFSRIVNSFDVMVGVHGAGLTNEVFLPENAVLIQVVPLGLEWGSRLYYELPAKAMNLRYLEYKVCRNESSVQDEFFVDDPVRANSTLLKHLAWPEFKKFYLDGQNVRIDVKRFRLILLQALEHFQ